MELRLKRIARKRDYTIGRLYKGGVYLCDTLEPTDRGLASGMDEDEVRRIKVKGQTAIPTGRYPVYLAKSPRFGRVLPRLTGVKGFTGILIHAGNTARDTEGCILVGENREVGKVLRSRDTLSRLVEAIKPAACCYITIE